TVASASLERSPRVLFTRPRPARRESLPAVPWRTATARRATIPPAAVPTHASLSAAIRPATGSAAISRAVPAIRRSGQGNQRLRQAGDYLGRRLACDLHCRILRRFLPHWLPCTVWCICLDTRAGRRIRPAYTRRPSLIHLRAVLQRTIAPCDA